MLGIFISYRRQDTKGYAGRLADHLEQVYGKELVFRDINFLVPGRNYMAEIERAIAASGIVLVLIGAEWASAADSEGNRRLDDDKDPLRQEIRTAMANSGVRVLPVLLEEAKMPRAERLPPDIRGLVDLHAITVSDQHWGTDVKRLIEMIDSTPGIATTVIRKVEVPGSTTNYNLVASIVVAAMFVGGALFSSVSRGPLILGLPVFSVVSGILGLLGCVLVLYKSLRHK